MLTSECLNFAEQERLRLNAEIEALQEEIRTHGQTKDAWDTIVRTADSDTECVDLAASQQQRLDKKIEDAKQKIRAHNYAKDAWDRIELNAQSEPRVYDATTYQRGQDAQWHVQRLNAEIDELQEEIRLNDECKDAWDLLVSSATGGLKATYLEFAKAGKEQLDQKIEEAGEKISRRIETREAWDTIQRVASSESRVYMGALYMMGTDRKWHLQQAAAGFNSTPQTSADQERAAATSKFHSMLQSLLERKKNSAEPEVSQESRPEPDIEPSINLPVQTNQQFLSLGLG